MNLKRYFFLFVIFFLIISSGFTVLAQAPASENPSKSKRPKVGLVMSGGGAKGFAYIGLLKVLQEVGLEVDYIGVIIGPDLIVRNGEIITDAGKRDGRDKTIRGYKKLLKEKPGEAARVIDDIIKNNNLKGNELLVIGDGPVEIKECRKANGIAIGIASDEVRRYGLNQEKRTRLIKSGAQIIIPDFSQADKLMELLFNE